MFKKHGIHISIKPHSRAHGGGANTFAWNFCRYLDRVNLPRAGNILSAATIVVIADKVDYFSLWLAKKTGSFIIHRLDEHFQNNESDARRKKHNRIIKINKLVDYTVYQSEFVRGNVQPHLNVKNYTVIINGADHKLFYDQGAERKYIGHVTNSVGDKKRLDLLEKAIINYPDEEFLLVGNHKFASIDFNRFRNVTLIAPQPREDLVNYYQQMKCLYFPSENDPCPNTVVEAVLSGVPVCYNFLGGTVEIVRDCGFPLEEFDSLLKKIPELRNNCSKREDLHFDNVIRKYLNVSIDKEA